MQINMSSLLKRTLGATIVVTLMSSAAAAQVVNSQAPVSQPSTQSAVNTGTPALTVAIKGGVNDSNLKLDDDSLPLTWLLGGVGGLSIGGNLTSNVGMKVEALYSQRGAKDDIENADAKERITYIDVPVTFHVGTSMNNGARVFLFTGPQVAYKIKSEIINDLDDTTTDTDEAIKDWEFGWTIGVGVAVQRVSLDARYTHGLTNINKTDGTPVKSQAVSVMVGIRLR